MRPDEQKTRRRGRLRPVAALACFGAAYHLVVRPRMLRWGATSEEARRTLPGDQLADGTTVDSTRAITIRAARATVWPWLVQLGEGRAGFYSYDLVERLIGGAHTVEGRRSATRIHPELQHLAVGDRVLFHPRAGDEVTLLDPERALVLGHAWAFVLEDAPGGATRLLARTRGAGWARALARGRVGRALGAAVDYAVGEPLHHLMERRMLKGIAERAEHA